jgi:Phospholipase_D-nuclease N-terminal
MSWIWPILVVVVGVIWTLSLLDLFVRRRHTMSWGRITLWVLAFFVFPIVGSAVYFVLHAARGGMPRLPDEEPLRGPLE